MKPYTLPLKVAKPNGNRVVAEIKQLGAEDNFIMIPFLEAVKQDDPPFAVDGVIRINYSRASHKEVIAKLTKYLEDLFLKELDNVSNNTKHTVKTDTGRSKTVANSTATSKGKGSKSSSVHDSGRGKKPAKSNRRGKSDSDMAKDSNPEA